MTIKSTLCPTCGEPMVSRLNVAKQQRFWGCKNFPACRGTRDTDGNARGEGRTPVPRTPTRDLSRPVRNLFDEID